MNKRINFKPRTETNGSDSAWNNLKALAENTRDIMLIQSASIAWLKENPDKTLQDLETKFRENNIPVYLIADNKFDINNEETGLIFPTSSQNELRYLCLWCCNPEEHCLQEINKYWSSYEENFEKLRNTGMIADKGDTYEEIFERSKNSKDPFFVLMHNKVQIEITDVDLVQELKRICKEVKDKSGKEVKTKKIGENNEGCSINGFFIEKDGQEYLITNLGVVIGTVNGERKTKVVDINNKQTWKL